MLLKPQIIFLLLSLSLAFQSRATLKESVFGSGPECWSSLQAVIIAYPIASTDEEKYVIQTKKIRYKEIWMPPKLIQAQSGSYDLRFTMLPGSIDGIEACQIQVEKTISNPPIQGVRQEMKSNGLEELSLIYRIKRELKIQRLLKRNSFP